MPQELIGRRLRSLLMDYLSSNSVLREIDDEFQAADIPRGSDPNPIVGGQRRSLVQAYYNGLNFSDPKDVRKFLNVLSVFMGNMERAIGSLGASRDTLDRFQDQLRRDGYAPESFGEAFGVAVVTPGADLRAAGYGIPGRVGPFNCGGTCHTSPVNKMRTYPNRYTMKPDNVSVMVGFSNLPWMMSQNTASQGSDKVVFHPRGRGRPSCQQL
jgi:hypothetical protein